MAWGEQVVNLSVTHSKTILTGSSHLLYLSFNYKNVQVDKSWNIENTVKPFNFKGTKLCDLTMMEIFVHT